MRVRPGVSEPARSDPPRDGAEPWLRVVLEHSQDILMVLDATGVRRFETASVERILGHSREELVGRPIWEHMHPDDRPRVAEAFARGLARPGEPVREEVRVRRKDGAYVRIEGVGINLLDDPQVGAVVVNARDVTERELTDPLLGLPSRKLFLHHVDRAAAMARETEGTYAVLAVGIDRFRRVNESLGDEAGDRLLGVVAARLRDCVGPLDVVARLGGDVFGVLVSVTGESAAPLEMAARVRATVAVPVEIAGQTLVPSVGIGIAAGQAQDEPAQLLRNAETALARAKTSGRGSEEVFAATMRVEARERLGLEAALHRALEAGAIEAHFQPIVDLSTGRVVALEALARWDGPAPPERLMAVAEQTGLAARVDAAVLERALAALARWQRWWPDLAVHANVSAAHLHERRLVDEVTRALARHRIPAAALTLEVTESALIEDREGAADTMKGLRALGVGLALDDFGTGYSSLAYLHHFPFDELKVDRTFVSGDAHLHRPGLLKAIVELGRSLELTVVAEGVESAEQLDEVRRAGCARAQGPHLSEPLSAARVPGWLEVRSPL